MEGFIVGNKNYLKLNFRVVFDNEAFFHQESDLFLFLNILNIQATVSSCKYILLICTCT